MLRVKIHGSDRHIQGIFSFMYLASRRYRVSRPEKYISKTLADSNDTHLAICRHRVSQLHALGSGQSGSAPKRLALYRSATLLWAPLLNEAVCMLTSIHQTLDSNI